LTQLLSFNPEIERSAMESLGQQRGESEVLPVTRELPLKRGGRSVYTLGEGVGSA